MSEQSRARWMAEEGKAIYDPWTTEIIEACDNPAFFDTHIDVLTDTYPGITNGAVLGPDQVQLPLFSKALDTIMQVDEAHGISERILMPHADKILRYTSARQFMSSTMKQGRVETKEQAVRAHAKDSLKFAMFFSAGVANDVFLEQTARAGQANERVKMMLAAEKQVSGKTFHDALAQESGPLWGELLDTYTPGDTIADLETAYDLRKLAFLERSLGNVSFVRSVNLLASAGFDTISNNAAVVEQDREKNWPAWMERAGRFGRMLDVGQDPEAIIDYDAVNDSFAVPHDVMSFVIEKLKEQRKYGLSEEAKRTAGESIIALDADNKTSDGTSTKALSSGCPVRNTESMKKTIEFTGKLYGNVVDYYAANGLAARL